MSSRRTIQAIRRYVRDMYEKHNNPDLSYHGYHHVLDVLSAANQHIRRLKIEPEEAHLVRVAAIMHDIGILWTYQGHELEGVKVVKEYLPRIGYSQEEVDVVCGIIMATKLPQSPKNLLEEIVCDSDLDYLGRNTFYSVGETLYREFLAFKVVQDRDEWNRLQLRFLNNHKYHTDYGKNYLQPQVDKRIKELEQELENEHEAR